VVLIYTVAQITVTFLLYVTTVKINCSTISKFFVVVLLVLEI